MSTIQEYAEREADVIDKVLADYKVCAGVLRGGVSFATPTDLHYVLGIGKAEKISSVRRALPELTLRLCDYRQDEKLIARIDEPPLALIVRRPDPKALHYKSAPVEELKPGMAILGRSYGYSGATSQILTLDNPGDCQTLIAGATGSGKSTLQRVMLASLLACTSPNDLEVLLVDMKNEDLLPFRNAPHVRGFAGDLDAAGNVLAYAFDQLQERIANNVGRRILVVIDELMLLNFGDNRIMGEWLPQIISVGRSKRIHIWAATQHPLASVVGSVVKANFTVRLVGKVANATASNVAAGVNGLEAHLLPGAGAFLTVRDGVSRLMQSYNMDADEAGAMVQRIARRDGAMALPSIDKPVSSGKAQNKPFLAVSEQTDSQTADETDTQTGLLPYSKPATRDAIRLCQLVYRTKGSKNQAIATLWPNRNKVTCKEYLDYALAFDLKTQKVGVQ